MSSAICALPAYLSEGHRPGRDVRSRGRSGEDHIRGGRQDGLAKLRPALLSASVQSPRAGAQAARVAVTLDADSAAGSVSCADGSPASARLRVAGNPTKIGGLSDRGASQAVTKQSVHREPVDTHRDPHPRHPGDPAAVTRATPRQQRYFGVQSDQWDKASTKATPLGVPSPVAGSQPGAARSVESVPKVITNQAPVAELL